MGLGTRIGKVASATYAATYSAPSTTAEDLTLTITTNSPTATTTLSIADGSSVTGTEISTALLALQTQVDALVVDIAATNTALAALAVDAAASAADNAAMLAQLNADE